MKIRKPVNLIVPLMCGCHGFIYK